jgi:hypothetical protein
MTLGRTVRFDRKAAADRHGRLLTQLTRDDGLWIQKGLLARGHARVHTRPDARDRASELLAAEARARTAGLGLWRDRAFAIRPADPDMLRRDRDSFQILEGQVLKAAKVRGGVYLNFGADWKTDVTVHIARAALRGFTKAGLDPLAYEGRRIRVRGWVGRRNGPLIEVTHPEQIEWIGE